LRYGWIDGQAKSLDDKFYLQKFTPRRQRSIWSKRNREHVARLTAEGLMQPPGLAEVERAKADGRWDAAYDSPANMQIHPEFQAALDKNPQAQEFFNSLTKSQRYSFNWRIHQAKRPETRQRHIEKFIGMLERGEKLH
jgi:uncharacterized protein YdeI (YjbR/CyaY-like superfamily)